MHQKRVTITTFPELRTVFIGPQGAHVTGKMSAYRGANPVRTALRTIPRAYVVHQENTRSEAIHKADVVIVFGAVKQGFGKPFLKLVGEPSPRHHATLIRSFLRNHKARSVAFVQTDGIPFWKIYKVVRRAFDWSQRDLNYLGDAKRQKIRQLHSTRRFTHKQLAEMFNCSQPAITFVVTGHTDRKHFKYLRKSGYVTLSSLATETGTNWGDVEKKAEDLGIVPVRTGPRSIMVRGEDKHRLKKALKRIRTRRDKE